MCITAITNFQQIRLQCCLQSQPWATGWLLRRCSSTQCKEVGKAKEWQDPMKLLWQLEVWPSGICWWAPFHGLWFPPHSLWKVTLAWWAHRSVWGSSALQTAGRCAINPRWPSFWKQAASKDLLICPGHRRCKKTGWFLVQLFQPARN